MVSTTQDAATVRPPWALRFLKADDPGRVAAAVKQVEVSTAAEVVPMVVLRSATVGHVWPILAGWGLALWFLYLASDAWLRSDAPLSAGWIEALGIVLMTGLAARLDFVRRWCTSDADTERAVWNRAVVEFYEAGWDKTADATGILLLVSLAERRAVVLADKAIAAVLPKEAWVGVVKTLSAGMKSGDLGKAFEAAIAQCGDLVKGKFPIDQERDRNELRDALVIKE